MKCINCGNHLVKTDTFCTRCGNKVNRKFWLRVLILGILAAGLPLLFLNLMDSVLGAILLFVTYIIGCVVVELLIKTNTKKEIMMSSLYIDFFQMAILFFLALIDVDAGGYQGLAVVGFFILEFLYAPVIFVINLIVGNIIGRKNKNV